MTTASLRQALRYAARVNVLRYADRVEVVMPPKQPTREARLFTAIAAAMLFWMIAWGARGIPAAWPRLRRLSPLTSRFDRLLLILLLLAAAGIAALMLGAAFALIVQLFPEDVRVVLRPGWVIEETRYGLYRRRRKLPANTVFRVVVHPPPRVNRSELEKEPTERQATITLDRDAAIAERVRLRGAFAHATAMELAQHIAQEISRLRGGAEVELIDVTDPGFVNADAPAAPAGCRFRTETNSGGVTLYSVPDQLTPLSLIRLPEFRVGLWVLGCLPLMYLTLAAAVGPAAPRAAIAFVLPYGAFGVLAMTRVVVARRTRMEFRARREGLSLIRESPLSRSTRRWPIGEITAISVAFRLGAEHRYRAVIEIHRTDGARDDLPAVTDVLTLRYLATQLRCALAIPGTLPNPCLTIRDSQWHARDEAFRPEDCPFTVEKHAGSVRIHKAAPGIGKCSGVVLAALAVGIAATILAMLLIPPHLNAPTERRAVVLGAAAFIVISLVGVLAIAIEASEEYEINAGADGLEFRLRTIIGTVRRSWSRDQIAAIRTGFFPRDARSPIAVVLFPTAGPEHRLIGGHPGPMRQLATVLRGALKVPARALGRDGPGAGPTTP